jgi:hypothetical protein
MALFTDGIHFLGLDSSIRVHALLLLLLLLSAFSDHYSDKCNIFSNLDSTGNDRGQQP